MTKKNKDPLAKGSEINDDGVPFGSHLDQKVTKLAIKFNGSLNDLTNNPDLAEWKVSSSEVFGIDANDEEAVQKLEDAILIKAKLSKVQSGFPLDINVDVKDVKSKNYMFKDGTSTHYLAYPKETNHKLNEVLLEPTKFLNSDYLKEHTKYTPKKLFQDVLGIPDSNFSYVGVKNPLIQVINLNAEQLQMKLNANDVIDDKYYKVDNSVLHECAEMLIEELSENFPITNLNEFSVNISRSDGLSFNDPEGVCDNVTSSEAITSLMNMKRDFACVLELTYSLS